MGVWRRVRRNNQSRVVCESDDARWKSTSGVESRGVECVKEGKEKSGGQREGTVQREEERQSSKGHTHSPRCDWRAFFLCHFSLSLSLRLSRCLFPCCCWCGWTWTARNVWVFDPCLCPVSGHSIGQPHPPPPSSIRLLSSLRPPQTNQSRMRRADPHGHDNVKHRLLLDICADRHTHGERRDMHTHTHSERETHTDKHALHDVNPSPPSNCCRKKQRERETERKPVSTHGCMHTNERIR